MYIREELHTTTTDIYNTDQPDEATDLSEKAGEIDLLKKESSQSCIMFRNAVSRLIQSAHEEGPCPFGLGPSYACM